YRHCFTPGAKSRRRVVGTFSFPRESTPAGAASKRAGRTALGGLPLGRVRSGHRACVAPRSSTAEVFDVRGQATFTAGAIRRHVPRPRVGDGAAQRQGQGRL